MQRVASRLGSGIVASVAFAVAAGYAFLSYWVVFVAKIGGVAMVIDARHGHGVHTGDLLAFPMAAFALLSFAVGVLAFDDAVHGSGRLPWGSVLVPARA